MQWKIDQNGFLNINGQSILARYTYCADTREAMEESRRVGFNSTFYGPTDPADRAGLLVIASPDAGYRPEDHIVNFIIDKPDFYREHNGTLKFPPSWVRERAQEWKKKSPGIPTLMFLYTRSSYALTREYIETGVDMLGLDFWLARSGWSLAALPPLLRNLKEMVMLYRRPASGNQGHPPLWVGLQISQTDIPVIGQDIPFATAEQWRTMVYMCLVNGVTGIGCWAYEYTDGATPDNQQHRVVLKDTVPELWQGVGDVMREIAELEPALTRSVHTYENTCVSVRYRVAVTESEICVLAVEELGVPQWAEVHVPGLPSLTSIDGIAYPGLRKCRFTGDGNSLSIREYFMPYQARAYRLFLPPSPVREDKTPPQDTVFTATKEGPPATWPCGWHHYTGRPPE